MSVAKFDISIRRNGVLIHGYLIDKDWNDIDEYLESVKALNQGAEVECVEYEGDLGLDDREYHEAREDV